MAVDLFMLTKKGLVKKEVTIPELQRLAASKIPFWLDLMNLQNKHLFQILSIFNIHKLVMEDCTSKDTRTKVEQFDDYNFLVIHGVARQNGSIHTTEIDIIQGKHWVISVHYHASETFEWLKKNQVKLSQILKRGSDFMMHALIDMEVDNYFPLLESVEEELEKLEDKVIEDSKPNLLNDLFTLKRQLLHVRKEIAPQREVMVALARRHVPHISSAAEVYFRDIYDHLIRITDTLDNYRETASNILEIHLSVTSNKMNEIMKVLTVIATIMMPLTVIGSIYGMNFKHMPELEWKWGYYAVLGFMALISISMLYYFRRRGWI